MTLKVKFCGAAGTVTGSCYWVRFRDTQFLVDCGMFQGPKSVKELNYGDFPFNPAEIDFVLLTHAHTDHAGMLPKLTKYGFTGPIYTTSGSRDLLTYMLPDSAHIQEMEVSRLNRRNRQRGRDEVEPIYTGEDVEACLGQIRAVDYEAWCELDGVRARFWNAGHILGAASVELEVTHEEGRTERMLFSGDIGPDHKLFHPDPEAPSGLDYLFMESTYGGRERADLAPKERRALLAHEINEALKGGGALVIPAFAVERTQELLLDIAFLLKSGDIPCVPVFLDSPLAIRVTSVFADHACSLEDVDCSGSLFNHSSFHFTETVEESKSIARFKGNMIILAASGMCDAGRIRHHLKDHLWRPQSTVLLVGYQAEGTLGRLLEQGKKRVKIQGEEIEVRANIRTIDTYSGHADHNGLMEWVKERLPVRRNIFLCHGSAQSLEAMRAALVESGIPDDQLIVPQLDDDYTLEDGKEVPKLNRVIRRLDPAAVEKPDWHNDLAALTLDLRRQLEAVKSDQQRKELLARLKELLHEYQGG
ncbi:MULTISPECIES: MBL fold metallo-hydrolase RNA specificity domain-containing protein [Kordiimonas]|jgi:metallo-beta-lactamase family protein|uniref:MBL fold metallo-hydrolase RNA specificity domain-containing protein n=1 Tax=Kordiimonas TaxID=288021 RepID=UPI00257DCD95|nr:MBL fold metallo-hydrolase [Kordiimonas sp. UBA4487]